MDDFPAPENDDKNAEEIEMENINDYDEYIDNDYKVDTTDLYDTYLPTLYEEQKLKEKKDWGGARPKTYTQKDYFEDLIDDKNENQHPGQILAEKLKQQSKEKTFQKKMSKQEEEEFIRNLVEDLYAYYNETFNNVNITQYPNLDNFEIKYDKKKDIFKLILKVDDDN